MGDTERPPSLGISGRVHAIEVVMGAGAGIEEISNVGPRFRVTRTTDAASTQRKEPAGNTMSIIARARGKLVVAADFDAPLPDDLLDDFER